MVFANREVCDMVICDYATKQPKINIDFANTNATEVTGDAVYAYGGQGHPKKVPFYGDKGGTFSFTTQLFNYQLYSLITGGALSNTAKFIEREVIQCATTDELTLSKEPIAGTVFVFAESDDCGTALEVTVDAPAKKVTPASGGSSVFTAGTSYVVYYNTELTGVQRLNIKSTTFPRECIIYGSTYDKGTDGNIYPKKLIVYRAAPQLNITLENSNNGDPVEMTVTFDLMSDDDDNMIDLISEEAS